MEASRFVTTTAQFFGVIFRRSTTQIKNPGALWDQALRFYPRIGGRPVIQPLEFRWPLGGRIKMAHLEHDNTVLDWQGSEIPLIMFDELTHFSAQQFWYMLSRNRSTSGVAGYVRATCNPDADSWVAELIAWWIDQDTGLAIPERCGVLRWFVRIADELHWADTPDELAKRFPGSRPKSLTFIASSLDDNPTLNRLDPGYRANLMALQRVERERLLGGNWKIRPSAGMYFRRGWCEVVDELPAGGTFLRGWDLAGTEYDGTNDPDFTSGTKIGRLPDGRFIVADHVWMRGSPAKVESLIKNTTSADGRHVIISLPQDVGQAGKSQVVNYAKILARYTMRSSPENGDKVVRFSPFSAQCEAGNVLVLRGDWNDRWFNQLEQFPEGKHDDDADSTSRAYNALMEERERMRIPDSLLKQAAAQKRR